MTASEVAQVLIAAGTPVNWDLDINRVIQDSDTVPDQTAIYGYRSSYIPHSFTFVFSTFHNYDVVRSYVARCFPIVLDGRDERTGIYSRHWIRIYVED